MSVELEKPKKIKVLVISDALNAPSGVGTQTKYFVDFLVKSGKFEIVALAGAMKHASYQPVKFHEWGDDVIMYPVDGYGNQDIVRQIIRTHKIDILWFMTDPRFYDWLWMIENEIRPIIPMVYYHVWDNYPLPHYNKKFYESNDVIITISKLTDDVVKKVAPNVERLRIPHVVDPDIFHPMNRFELKEQVFKDHSDKFVMFFNSRNARRKMSGSLIFWFSEFLKKVGKDKSVLLMHTDPKDPNGQDLNVILRDLGLTNGEVMISNQHVPQEYLAKTYNAADLTVLLSNAEGFGLSVIESLNCATPVLVNMTGGLQEQVTDGKKWFGKGLRPVSRPIVGAQETPYIYEDCLSEEVVVSAMFELYKKWKNNKLGYYNMGFEGHKYVTKTYNFEKVGKMWIDKMLEIHEKYGSWETRKGYKQWELKEF